MTDVALAWWEELRACALVGTGRRAVPALPELSVHRSRPAGVPADGGDGTDPIGDLAPSAVGVLDAAALGAVARRAGRRAELAPAGSLDPAPPAGDRAEAPATAAQLLDLLIGAAPMAGIHRNDLLGHWCVECAAAGRRVPDPLLVRLLDHATATSTVRPSVRAALGLRGWWLAALNPAWSWADVDAVGGGHDGAPTLGADEWARLPSAQRVELLRQLRRHDPAAGRELLSSTWSSDSAAARAAHLAVLASGLGPADEAVLERALDDRAKGVRAEAVLLLDGLPGSARAQRMADRLRPLLSIEGRRRSRSVVVALPDDPDPAAVRDGLTPPPPARSARGFWLEQLAAGAPLTVWTELTGDEPAVTLDLLAAAGDDVRAGILRAVLARRDPVWAGALHRSVPDPRLLDLLPVAERVEVIRATLRSQARPNGVRMVTLIEHLPGPWSRAISDEVIGALRAGVDATTIQQLTPMLGPALDPGALATVRAWLAGLEEQPHLAAALRTLIQYQSLHRSITEAFR